MEQIEKAINWFENIAEECDKLTSGNVAHLKAQIKGMAIRSAEYLKKHSQEPASEDLEKELKYYCNDYYNCDYPKQLEEENCSEVMPHIVSAANHFAQWQREQMMKDAAEGQFDYNHIIVPYNELARVCPNGKDGDKVKVIIIKE